MTFENWIKLFATYGPFALILFTAMVLEPKARTYMKDSRAGHVAARTAVYVLTWVAVFVMCGYRRSAQCVDVGTTSVDYVRFFPEPASRPGRLMETAAREPFMAVSQLHAACVRRSGRFRYWQPCRTLLRRRYRDSHLAPEKNLQPHRASGDVATLAEAEIFGPKPRRVLIPVIRFTLIPSKSPRGPGSWRDPLFVGQHVCSC